MRTFQMIAFGVLVSVIAWAGMKFTIKYGLKALADLLMAVAIVAWFMIAIGMACGVAP